MAEKRIGTATDVFATETVTDNFQKRVLWLKTEEQYPQHIEIQFVNQNTGLLDDIKAGDRVEVTFDIRGKQHTKGDRTYIFNSLNGWAIRKM